MSVCSCMFTHTHSIAERGECFQQCLFVCLSVRMITSERLNVRWWSLALGAFVQKSPKLKCQGQSHWEQKTNRRHFVPESSSGVWFCFIIVELFITSTCARLVILCCVGIGSPLLSDLCGALTGTINYYDHTIVYFTFLVLVLSQAYILLFFACGQFWMFHYNKLAIAFFLQRPLKSCYCFVCIDRIAW